ncbi:20310_t:CDS:1, partial [Gigaspora rosea]
MGTGTKTTCKRTMLGKFVCWDLSWYSPSCEYYYYIFSGVEAYETLSQIFKDPKWGVHEYKNQQQTWVVLVSQDTNQIQPKMVIQWRSKKIKDEANHVSEA